MKSKRTGLEAQTRNSQFTKTPSSRSDFHSGTQPNDLQRRLLTVKHNDAQLTERPPIAMPPRRDRCRKAEPQPIHDCGSHSTPIPSKHTSTTLTTVVGSTPAYGYSTEYRGKMKVPNQQITKGSLIRHKSFSLESCSHSSLGRPRYPCRQTSTRTSEGTSCRIVERVLESTEGDRKMSVPVAESLAEQGIRASNWYIDSYRT